MSETFCMLWCGRVAHASMPHVVGFQLVDLVAEEVGPLLSIGQPFPLVVLSGFLGFHSDLRVGHYLVTVE